MLAFWVKCTAPFFIAATEATKS